MGALLTMGHGPVGGDGETDREAGALGLGAREIGLGQPGWDERALTRERGGSGASRPPGRSRGGGGG